MLTITIPTGEQYDRATNRFYYVKGQTISLIHSLVSISKWEEKWHKAYLGPQEKTREEVLDYVRCMTVTKNVDPELYNFLSTENVDAINKYINDPHTATMMMSRGKNGSPRPGGTKDVITAELIYFWMITYNIPVEFQKWHLNKLLALIDVCERKTSSGNNGVGKGEMLRNRRALNKARHAKHGY